MKLVLELGQAHYKLFIIIIKTYAGEIARRIHLTISRFFPPAEEWRVHVIM